MELFGPERHEALGPPRSLEGRDWPMSQALFRADGSAHLGMGHIMRSLAFADGLEVRGVESVFVTKTRDKPVTDLIRSRGYANEEIPPETTSTDDARLTLEIAGRSGANLIVTDISHRVSHVNLEDFTEYHRVLGERYFTVCVSGENLTELPVQIVVNPYFRTSYPTPRADAERMVLLGPSYSIFGQGFREAAQVNRNIAAEGRRVLVSVGGSDSLHLTVKIVKAICAIPRDDLALRIILGPASSGELKSEIVDTLRQFRGDTTLSDHEANMAEVMLWADLAITGDGLTKYETAVTGTPSIMLSRFDSPKALNQQFEKAGTTRHLGDGGRIIVDDLAREIQDVLSNASLRASMSEKGKALVDGQGLERIISKLPPEVID